MRMTCISEWKYKIKDQAIHKFISVSDLIFRA